MILKEWSEALDVYKAALARGRRALKAIMARHKVKSYWYVWATFLFMILSAVSVTHYRIMDLYGIIAHTYRPKWYIEFSLWLITTLAALCFFGATEKALDKKFELDFIIHGISHYPFWSRRTYFNYVLFLDELKYRKYSHKQVAELSSFAEIAVPPEPPRGRPFQNPIVIPLMGVLTALCIEVVRQSVSNNGEALLSLIFSLVLPLLFLVIGVHSIYFTAINSPKARHQIIQRYLKWAERDLPEEQFS
jgi:hypothetical protein